MRCLALALLASTALTAAAQEGGQSDDMSRALAAGYKASFVCSATFNAGQSMNEIEANELRDIYPDYRDALKALPAAKIDFAEKRVSVEFDRNMPPRLAVWREGLGCAQLPIGADERAVAYLPRFQQWPAVQSADDAITLLPGIVPEPVSLASYGTFDAAVNFAFDRSTYGDDVRTSAVLIVHKGEILAEQYARGIDATTPQRTWSVAKSLSATFVGAAVWKGLISIDHDAVIDEWSGGADPRRAITLRNLLHMASGLDSGGQGSRTDRVYFGGSRVTDTAITRSLEAAPGTRFKYANNDTLAAMRSLREQFGNTGDYLRFPYENVLWKIGAFHTTLETDWNGDYVSSSQVWSTARDLARIGLLYINDGMWGGERILPEDWLEFVTTPAPAQPTDGEFGYGAQFWLFNHPGVPADAFAAMGHRGQYIVIIPSRELVIVRRGYDASGGGRFDIARFTADVNFALNAAYAAKEQEEMRILLGEDMIEPESSTRNSNDE